MKTFVTLGLIADKYVVLKDPSVDYTAHREALRGLIADGGKIKDGKTASKQVSQAAIVLANASSIVKRAKFK